MKIIGYIFYPTEKRGLWWAEIPELDIIAEAKTREELPEKLREYIEYGYKSKDFTLTIDGDEIIMQTNDIDIARNTAAYHDDLIERLKDPEYADAYLKGIIEENSKKLTQALKDIQDAHFKDIQERTGLIIKEVTQEHWLYKPENKHLLEEVKKGLEQSARDETVSWDEIKHRFNNESD